MSKKKLKTDAPPSAPGNDSAPVKGARWKFALVLIAFAAFIGLCFLFVRSVLNTKSGPKPSVSATSCLKPPSFISKLGFTNQAALSTSEKAIKGIAIIEKGKKPYQHESWKSAGSLAPIQLSSDGGVFVGPAPMINVLDNPFEEQTTIYRIDPISQEMKPFAKLPLGGKATSENPFGIAGLGFDCESDSLYASSLSGSERGSEKGRIFQLDAANGKIKSSIDNIDAFGIGIYGSSSGKRLYFGLARIPEIWSIGIDESGAFLSDSRKEISLEGMGPRGDDKARKIRFQADEMQVLAIEFNFNLIAPTEKQETLYRFKLNSQNNSWQAIK